MFTDTDSTGLDFTAFSSAESVATVAYKVLTTSAAGPGESLHQHVRRREFDPVATTSTLLVYPAA